MIDTLARYTGCLHRNTHQVRRWFWRIARLRVLVIIIRWNIDFDHRAISCSMNLMVLTSMSSKYTHTLQSSRSSFQSSLANLSFFCLLSWIRAACHSAIRWRDYSSRDSLRLQFVIKCISAEEKHHVILLCSCLLLLIHYIYCIPYVYHVLQIYFFRCCSIF